MKITPTFNSVPVSFDTDEVGIFCQTNAINGNVEMYIHEKGRVWNLPVAIIKQHSRDLYVDFNVTKEDATKFGNEIARRWNEFPQWKPVTDEKYPIDKKVLCRMKSNGAIVSGYIYKENGVYKVATSSDFHFEDYGDYECDLYMLIPEFNND